MNKKKLGLILAIAAPILWGSSGTVAQNIFDTYRISATWLVTIRMSFSGVLLLIFAILGHKNIFGVFKNKDDFIRFLFFTVLGMMGVQIAYVLSINAGNAATAAILQYLTPVIIVIFLAFKHWMLPSRSDAISIVVSIIGTVLIITQGKLGSLAVPLPAVIWGMLAATGGAFYSLLPQKLLAKYGTLPVVGWSMIIGGLITSIFSQAWKNTPKLNTDLVVQVGFVVIFGTMFAYYFYIQSLEFINPTTASVLGALEPLSAAILSFIFLNVRFNGYGILGIALVLSVTFMQFIYAQRVGKIAQQKGNR